VPGDPIAILIAVAVFAALWLLIDGLERT